MNVNIQKLGVDLPIKNKGIEIRVRENDDTFLGDFYVTSVGIEWCKGRIAQGNGRSMPWKQFIKLMEENP
jgi:hypothetical protein